MIRLIVAIENMEIYKSHIEVGIKELGLPAIQISDAEGHPRKTITSKWNIGLEFISKNDNNLSDNDIIMFCHDDVNILDNDFLAKMEYLTTTNYDVGVFGVVGKRALNYFWGDYDVGHWVSGEGNENGVGKHVVYNNAVGYFDDVIVVGSGLFGIRYGLLKANVMFNDSYGESPELAVYDMCLQILKKGYKIATIDTLMFHSKKNVGDLGNGCTGYDDFVKERGGFVNKDNLGIQHGEEVVAIEI